MNYFETYVSNCTAGAGPQSFFETGNPAKVLTGRAYFRPTVCGTHGYSFLYSNITDGTFVDESVSRCNLALDEWTIDRARVCVCDGFAPSSFQPLTFDGKREKTVSPGELFFTDEITLSPAAGQYLCIELTFHGSRIPCHPETLVPTTVDAGDGMKESRDLPLPSMIGCDLRPKARIVFWGDSITQGIGTEPDSYRHYASVVAGILGSDYSYWDIGLGFGRASDAASDGAWAYMAKQGDLVTVCFGVNDIYGHGSAPIASLEKTLSILRESGATVVLQTVPPFDYDAEHKAIWEETNAYLREVLRTKADGFLDVTEFLSDPARPEHAIFGGHPNAEGNAIWGKKLAAVIAPLLRK